MPIRKQQGQSSCAKRAFTCIANKNRTYVDTQHSPLLCLPAELRNRIYGYVFGVPWIRACCGSDRFCTYWGCNECIDDILYRFKFKFHYPRRLLALTETCRQIHEETKILPFVLNKFHGKPESIDRALHYYLDPEQSNAVTAVCFLVRNNGLEFEKPSIENLYSLPLQQDLAEALDNISYLRNLKSTLR